jgi:hypothetical protein
MASMIVRRGERTEKHPLTAHAQGIRDASLSPRIRMPAGKGTPIKNPRGKRIRNTRAIFEGIGRGEIILERNGRSRL